MATKIKALQQWCRRITDGYRDVDIKDFTVSWRDGLAFCAMIHRFRPDLIDYDSLSKENVYDNNHLAFTVAENELDIPAFLEAADMVALKTPDKLSIITYVSQYYNKLNSLPQLGGPGVREKTAPAASQGTKRHQKPEPLSEPEPKKQPPTRQADGKSTEGKSKVRTLGDTCGICKNKVYLLERHVEDGKLYHRSCFRHSDLSPTNKVYTRSPFLSPSLHGKDGGRTPTSKSSSSAFFPSDKTTETASRTYVKDEKHDIKVQSDKSEKDDKHKKPDVQKHLFSDKSIAGAKEDGVKGSLSKEKHHPHESKTHTFEKHSMDFLSADKDAKDVKSPKRQLPLIFQTDEKSNDDATGKTKNTPDIKTLLPSKNKSETSQVSVHSGIRDEHYSKTVKKVGVDTKHSSSTGTKAAADKPASESAVSQKSTAPVAKPRNLPKKTFEEKMDTSEPPQTRDKSPAFPRPAPRISLSHVETSKKSAPSKQTTPPALRKARSKSPARDLSQESSHPPPLPSSAPPPLPSQAPNASSGLPSPGPHTTPAHPGHKFPTHSKSGSKDHASSSSSKELFSNSSKNLHLPDAKSEVKTTSSSAVPQRPSPIVSISSSKTAHSSVASISATSTPKSSSSSSVSSTFTSVTTLNLAFSKGGEEPMDVDTAINMARSQHGEEPVAVMVVPTNKTQQDKAVLTGLLHSLAGVRNASSTSSSSSTPTSASKTGPQLSKTHDKFHAPPLESKSASNNTDKHHSNHHLTSESKSASDNASKSGLITPTHPSKSASDSKTVLSSTGFISRKVLDSHHQNKESDQKMPELSLNARVKNETVLPRFDKTGKLPQASHIHEDILSSDKKNTDATKTKISPRSFDTDADIKLPDKKHGETVTETRNLENKKPEESRRPKSAILSGFELRHNGKSTELNGKEADDVPAWKKYQQQPLITITSKSQTDLSDNPSVDMLEKRDRAKSAADIFSMKGLSTPKQKATTPDTLQPPAFTQVKLRESGMSTLERKERSKSTGFVIGGSSSDSKSEWQLEAERRMAALRDTGFVDPELKKSSTGSTSPIDDDTSPRDVVEMPQTAKAGKDLKPEAFTGKQPPPAEQVKIQPEKAKLNLHLEVEDSYRHERTKVNFNPKGILRSDKTKSEEKATEIPPPKPERNVHLKTKQTEPGVHVAAPSSPRPAESLPLSLPKEQEVVVAPPRRKIGVDSAEGGHTKSPPPRPSSPPHRQERKKITVDATFDFNSSNSVELSPKKKETPSPVKLTPPRPPPPSRPPAPKTTNASPGRISAIELQHQLLDIDSKLSALELRGRELEESIRSVAAEEEDDKMMEWFQLVTEKNELVRKETDLVYMSREQDLEDEQSQLESQLQYLLSIDEHDKSLEEKEEEEYLIQRKLDIVNQRNSIVDSIDENRLRYEEEDRDIAEVLEKKGFRKNSMSSPGTDKGKSEEVVKERKKVGTSTFYA